MKKLFLTFSILASFLSLAETKTTALPKKDKLRVIAEELANTWKDENITSYGYTEIQALQLETDNKKNIKAELRELNLKLLQKTLRKKVNNDYITESDSKLKDTSVSDFSRFAFNQIVIYALEPFDYTNNKEMKEQVGAQIETVLVALEIDEDNKNGLVITSRTSIKAENGTDYAITQVIFYNTETQKLLSFFLHQGSM